MDYEGFSKERLAGLHAEGRYRVFADLDALVRGLVDVWARLTLRRAA